MTKSMAAFVLLGALEASAAGPQKYQGRVTRFDARSGKISLSLVDHSTGSWTLLPDARVISTDHRPLSRMALHPGSEVEVSVSEDGKVRQVWLVETDWGKAFEGGKIKRWDGKVIAIQKRDPLTFEVSRRDGKAKMSFKLGPATRVVFGHEQQAPTPATPQDIRDGATVLVLFSMVTHQVTEVLIRQ